MTGPILSLEGDDGRRCVDILPLVGGGFGFKEFRRDPEDGGRWTLVADSSATGYESQDAAIAAATTRIAWLAMERAEGRGGGS